MSTIATPQITVRVDENSQIKWAETARAHGYNTSELIRALMDGASDGSVGIPVKEATGQCLFDCKPEDCDQPRLVFPWSELCGTCKHRFRG